MNTIVWAKKINEGCSYETVLGDTPGINSVVFHNRCGIKCALLFICY